MYDYAGEEIESKLYSFKEGAIPVNCWCMKADYAESSGTHNTGIARIWNDVMKNMKVDNEYVCRTNAQKAALQNGYNFDVRTTVDGFPILMFYRLTATSDLVFIGKYNFNNDKSTESVFGFTDIPGFDNTNMQCWEVLNNGDALALFTDVSDFDSRWSEAYESRYPDTKNPNTSALKAFAVWMNGVTQENFVTEKWQHLDVYKMAAYYVYVMRFGAVDQTVKNSMLTSEDGQKFYFINYDNDTIIGLRNDGLLIYPPTMTRQTLDETYTETVYAYAGHDSRLWNCLEADSEFMAIVQIVDNALYNAGLTYANVIKMFDEEQAGKWAERIYNQDAQYKYVGPYTESGTNNLFMLQGPRSSHRRWWLSKRFAFIDSLFVSGEYKANVVEAKLAAAPIGLGFSITAGIDGNYGYGVNNIAKITGVELKKGDSYTFTTDQVLNVGDPLRLYAAPNIEAFDFSGFIQYMSTLSIAGVNSSTLGSSLKKIVLGVDSSSSDKRNTSLSEISGLQMATRLEELNIEGYRAITSLQLDSLHYLRVLKAKASGLTGISLPDGSPIELLELPASTQGIFISNANNINSGGIIIEGGWSNISTISIKYCSGLTSSWSFINSWNSVRVTEASKCSVTMEGINWTGVSIDDLISLGSIKTQGGVLSLKGKITLEKIDSDSDLEKIETLKEIFGEFAFTQGSELWITAPESVFVLGPDSILEGESAQFEAVVFSDFLGTVSFRVLNATKGGISIDSQTGFLTSEENNDASTTCAIQVIHTSTQGVVSVGYRNFSVNARVYPSASTTIINGEVNPKGDNNVYYWSSTTPNLSPIVRADWSLSEELTDFLEITSFNENQCTIKLANPVETSILGTLNLTLYRVVDNFKVLSISKQINLLNSSVLMTNVTNPEAMAKMYSLGWAANETYMTYDEAAKVTDSMINPGTSNSTNVFCNEGTIVTFNEFEYFYGVTKLPNGFFMRSSSGGKSKLESIKLPPTLTSIGDYCLGSNSTYTGGKGSLIKKLVIPEGVTKIGSYFAVYCTNLESISIPSTLNSAGAYFLFGCSSLKSVDLKYMTFLAEQPLGNCTSLEEIYYPDAKFGSTNALPLASKVYIRANTFYVDSSNGSHRQWDSRSDVDVTFIISPENSIYYTVNGFELYSGTTLLKACSLTNKKLEIREGTLTLSSYCCSYVGFEEVYFPNSINAIGRDAFTYASSIKEISLGENVTYIAPYAFAYCKGVSKLTIKALTAPTIDYYTFWANTDTYLGVNSTIKDFYIRHGATGYNEGHWASKLLSETYCGFTQKYLIDITECTSLVITANDVTGRNTSTMITYTAIVNGTDPVSGEPIIGIEITDSVISEDFEINSSTEEERQVEVSFTYYGVTATTIITQGVFVPTHYSVDLNSQWGLASTPANPDSSLYEGVYRSESNYHASSKQATMYIDIVGYETFKFYVRSNGEAAYDYLIVGELDKTPTASSYKVSTKNSASSGTAISNYTLVEYTGIDGGSHRITIIYLKDSSGDSGDDRGFVLIPKNQ